MPRKSKANKIKSAERILAKAEGSHVNFMRPPPVVERLRKKGQKKSGIVKWIDRAVGKFTGIPNVGTATGRFLNAITGSGAYRINSNSLIESNAIPQFMQSGDGYRMKHRVFLEEITGSSLFVNRVYPINPGLYLTFPWLNVIANQFEEYDMKGLVFEYRPSSGSAIASTNNALGVVIMATDYDAANPAFVDRKQMESYEFSVSTVTSQGALHPVECAPKRNVLESLFVRSVVPPANTDIRLYDMGNFQLGTVGQQAAVTIGELWVAFDVVFRKPRIDPSGISPVSGLSLHLRDSPANTTAYNHFFGTTAQVASGTSMDLDVDYILAPSGTSTGPGILRPGWYVLSVAAASGAAAMASSALTLSFGSNVILGPSIFQNDSATGRAEHYLDGVPVIHSMSLTTFIVGATGDLSTNHVTLDYASSAASGGTVDCFINLISRDHPMVRAFANALQKRKLKELDKTVIDTWLEQFDEKEEADGGASGDSEIVAIPSYWAADCKISQGSTPGLKVVDGVKPSRKP